MATTEVPRPHQTNAMPEAIAANAAGVDMPQMAAPHMAVEPVEKPIENPFDLEAAFAKPRVTVESDAAGFATAPGPMSFAPAGEHGGVNVTNTMSRDQFNRMFAQMKGAYGLSIFSALWRTLLLMVFCTIIIALFVTAIVYLGLGH